MLRALSLTVALVLAWAGTSTVAQAEPAAAPPDLSGFEVVDAQPYVVGGAAYFTTSGGLQCAILSSALAGCSGDLPGAPRGATEVRVGDDVDVGWWESAGAQFVPASGFAPILEAGHKLSVNGVECAVGATTVSCVASAPHASWFTLSPDGASVGPATPGLPEGFPDPRDYVLSANSFIVGEGPRNIFPFFAVGDGFTCEILMYSSGSIGCHGPLAGTGAGANTIELAFGDVTISTTPAQFAAPTFPGEVLTLQPGFRVSGYAGQGTCVAVVDGVACYDGPAGFLVTSTETRIFG